MSTIKNFASTTSARLMVPIVVAGFLTGGGSDRRMPADRHQLSAGRNGADGEGMARTPTKE